MYLIKDIYHDTTTSAVIESTKFKNLSSIDFSLLKNHENLNYKWSTGHFISLWRIRTYVYT